MNIVVEIFSTNRGQRCALRKISGLVCRLVKDKMFPLHLWGLVSLFVHQPAHHHLPLSSYFPCFPPLTTSASHPAALMSFLRVFWHVVLMNCTHTLSLSVPFSLFHYLILFSIPHFLHPFSNMQSRNTHEYTCATTSTCLFILSASRSLYQLVVCLTAMPSGSFVLWVYECLSRSLFV